MSNIITVPAVAIIIIANRHHKLRIMVTMDIKIDMTIPIIGAKNINKIVFMIVSLSTILAQE